MFPAQDLAAPPGSRRRRRSSLVALPRWAWGLASLREPRRRPALGAFVCSVQRAGPGARAARRRGPAAGMGAGVVGVVSVRANCTGSRVARRLLAPEVLRLAATRSVRGALPFAAPAYYYLIFHCSVCSRQRKRIVVQQADGRAWPRRPLSPASPPAACRCGGVPVPGRHALVTCISGSARTGLSRCSTLHSSASHTDRQHTRRSRAAPGYRPGPPFVQ